METPHKKSTAALQMFLEYTCACFFGIIMPILYLHSTLAMELWTINGDVAVGLVPTTLAITSATQSRPKKTLWQLSHERIEGNRNSQVWQSQWLSSAHAVLYLFATAVV
jgi:hypothetical protein